MSDLLKLAVPSKGSMEEPTLRFLSDCGLAVKRGNPRQYSASLSGGLPIQAVFQRAADIPQKLQLGLVDAGITGFDIFHEHLGESDAVVAAVEDLGFARCSLVLAVPEAWLDVSAFEDLADVASEFRRRGRALRIATKFPRLVRRFLLSNGLNSFTLVEGSGALEIAPQMGYADLIADINETGTTLRANHLKPIIGGTVLESHACLLVNRARIGAHPERLQTTRGMLEMIEAHQRASGVLSVTANVEGDSMQAVADAVLARRELAGMRGPTVTPVFDPAAPGRVFAVTLVVPQQRLAAVKDHLRQLGGGAITVTRLLYAFDERSSLYDRLLEQLGAALVE
ncbi:MAG TPA: ATP phosphoribosyltransferase [Chloroflexota bacterium]|nr:ATP phosphoribosyltransferase [Chloroflexota bacterium]